MRKTDEELREIALENNVDTIWSWSRYEKAKNYLYEFYLRYIKHVPEDRSDSVYGVMGSLCHNTLEKYYNGLLPYDEMIKYFEDSWMVAVEISDLKFDRNDENKNHLIGTKYKENLEHFFKNFVPIPYEVKTEEFILTKWTDQIVFQGYADAIYKDSEDNYYIIDFKTSTKYSPADQKEKCGQLVCYAYGLYQTGIPLNKIRIAWDFLKYVKVTYTQANGKEKERYIERRSIGESLKAAASAWLKKYSYDVDSYIDQMVQENSIDVLPEMVRNQFSVNECYVYVDLTEALISEWKEKIETTINDITEKIRTYEEAIKTNPDADYIFYDDLDKVENDSYYYATLSGYSSRLNKPYKEYLDKLEAQKNGEISFAGVGSDLDWLDI